MRFIDTHCHLDFDVFKDNISHQLSVAKAAGVDTIILPAVGESNWLRIEALAKQYPEIYYALGCHPFFMDQHRDDVVSVLSDKLAHRHFRCVAIGECGLDKVAAKTPAQWEKQRTLFKAHCSLAVLHNLPLIIHSRNAHSEVIEILKHKKPAAKGVIHGFSGSYQQAMQYVELGFYIGVGGTITYPRANKTRKTISKLPLSALLLETDSPDMPTYGRQGAPNHPQYVREIFDELCLLRSEDAQTIASLIVQNSNSLFKI
ncbi:TatD family hydrolase [Aliivibrio kagoshimensis]|uniref:TatD family hydrolase n=1 Tax=Aliivibrio kagoshimensis TaxID=2910230 RepID=UPI003D14FCA2